jgi:type IV pilus assembly protein PilC
MGEVVEGTRQALDEANLVAWLRSQGLLPISVSKTVGGETVSTEKGSLSKTLLAWKSRLALVTTVATKDKAIFVRQLATMVGSGMTLSASLDILKDQTSNRRLAVSIGQVKKLLDGGWSLSAAMKTRKEFSPLMVAMVQAGEEGGLLDTTLSRLALFLEKQEALRRKVTSAVTYPSVVLFFAVLVLYVLVTFIVPKFEVVFSQMGGELPALTHVVFTLSSLMKQKWYICAGAVFLLFFLGFLLNRFPKTRPYVDRLKLRLPITGDILQKAIMARSMRTLASLVQAGVPILSGLTMTAEVADNTRVASAFLNIREAARKGVPLGETAKKEKIFPLMVAHMITVGEQTGHLEEMLNKIADWFEMELDEKVSKLTSVLEPVLILFVGGIVAIVALSIFLPIIGAIQTML